MGPGVFELNPPPLHSNFPPTGHPHEDMAEFTKPPFLFRVTEGVPAVVPPPLLGALASTCSIPKDTPLLHLGSSRVRSCSIAGLHPISFLPRNKTDVFSHVVRTHARTEPRSCPDTIMLCVSECE